MLKYLIFILSFSVGPAFAGPTVYLTPAEALKIIFADSKEIISEKKGGRTFFVAKTGGKVDGYALIGNEIGKTEPITFMTAITPQGKVKAVEILVYRESHGGEVKEKRFTNQYKGKCASDPVRIGQDIKNLSGATLSARAVSRGVKDALILWKTHYEK
ncbi:MAG: FMN-binding protein [Deltaproteobacteria bacterium]|nr:FMN-binding protein [Deltaproteobacteria bacterium]